MIVVKIGRLLDHPTTAGAMDYGRAALDLIFDPVNAAGGVAGQRITIVEADAVGSVERVIAGARRLATEGCLLILGPSVTDLAVPRVPVLEQVRVPATRWSS